MTSTYRYRHSSIVQKMIECVYRFKIFIIGAVALLGVMYIVQANTVSAHGIKVQSLQREIAQTQRDYQQLEIQVASSQSMATLNARIQALQLVPVEHPAYITLTSGAVALR